ncbi:hypothetical protein [Thiolapillus sp.]|uniref:hypothetical protein n=1 Tax=Thiolapillus sp. TaxID=2017437 RepID=UPI003AF5D2D3
MANIKVIHKQKKMQANPHSKQANPHSWGRSTRALPIILMKRMKGKIAKKKQLLDNS